MKENRTKVYGRANLFGLLLFVCFNLFAKPVANHMDEQWLKLLRYNKTIFGYESEVDYPRYFLSKKGKKSPKDEFEASIKAFNSLSVPANINEHSVCLFPGRYLYLKLKNKVKPFDLKRCTDYQKFRKKLDLNSVSLVFSSYYINKPASAFGHTFLKLNQGDAYSSDLKSYGVDFSAQVTTKNAFLYGVMGMFGGFYGRFSLLPYFLKLREYNDYESRDLWEFELKLSENDLDLFAAHLWDMNLALFDYYYFTENCSYHVFRFMDAIKPEWNLWDETYKILVPIDTLIPLLGRKDVLAGIYLRESIQKRVNSKLKKLNQKELEYIKTSIEHKKLGSLDQIKRRSLVLDSMIDFIDYKFPKEIHLKNDSLKDFKMSVLAKRSKLPSSKEAESLKKRVDTFDYGHKPRRFTLSSFNSDHFDGLELEHRFALHNIMERTGGAYSNFTLEMGKTSVQYDTIDKKIFFNQFTLAEVLALRPMNYLEKMISWNFSVGVKRDEVFREKIGFFTDVGLGGAVKLGASTFSLFAQTYFSEIGRTKELADSLAGARVLWNIDFKNFALMLDYNHLYRIEKMDSPVINYDLAVQYNYSRNWALNLSFAEEFRAEELNLSLVLYY